MVDSSNHSLLIFFKGEGIVSFEKSFGDETELSEHEHTW